MPKRKPDTNKKRTAKPKTETVVVMDVDGIPDIVERPMTKAKCEDGKHVYEGPPHPTILHGVHPDATCSCGRRFGG